MPNTFARMTWRKVFKTIYLACLALVAGYFDATGQTNDTITLSLQQAEQRFLQENFLLLASKFEIEAAQGAIIQAKLFNNPEVYLEQNVYNPNSPDSRKFFNTSKNGQNILQVMQLFELAGKRNKRVALEKINKEIAEHQFYDLLRSLKYELRVNFIDLYYHIKSLKMYDQEVSSLRTTINLFQEQYEKGNIALKEVLRLKAFLLSLESEQNQLYKDISEKQAILHILMNLQGNTYIKPVLENSVDKELSSTDITSLIDTAKNYRSDLKIHEAALKRDKQMLSLQKAMSIPDIKAGGVYDKAGSFIQNYIGIGLQVDLPVFNRNQGNIKIAESRIKQSEALYNEMQKEVESQITKAFQQTKDIDELVKRYDKTLEPDFDLLIEGLLKSFTKRNITLLELIDYYESYKNSILTLHKLQIERLSLFEELNYYTGTNIFNIQ
ncbi:MAG TPA: TolC family protein [Cytophagaceae bacterium]